MSATSYNPEVLYYYLNQFISKTIGAELSTVSKDDFSETDIPKVDTIIKKSNNKNGLTPCNMFECANIIEKFSNFEKLTIIRALIMHSLHYKYNKNFKDAFQETSYNIFVATLQNMEFTDTINMFMHEASKKAHPFFYELFVSNGHNKFTQLCMKNTTIRNIIQHLWYDTTYTDIYADNGYETFINDPNTNTKKWGLSYERSLDICAKRKWSESSYNNWIDNMRDFL